MNILLSIKPKYVKAILEGSKKYEFRKNIFKAKNIKKIYIYSTSPVKKVVGVFKIGNIIEDLPENLWEQFKDFSGIKQVDFFNYFNGNTRGYAIQIKEIEIFENPQSLTEIFPGHSPPQSFCYVNKQKDIESWE